jgi:hypothetical protein
MDEVTRKRVLKSLTIFGQEIADAVHVAAEAQLVAEETFADLFDRVRGSAGVEVVGLLRGQVEGMGADPDEFLDEAGWNRIADQVTESLTTAMIENAADAITEEEKDTNDDG